MILQAVSQIPNPRVVKVQDRRAAWAEPLKDFPFSRLNRVQRTQGLQVAGTDVANNRDIRRCNFGQALNLPAETHAHLGNKMGHPRVRRKKREGNANRRVIVALGYPSHVGGRQHRPNQLFNAGLTDAAGDPDDANGTLIH